MGYKINKLKEVTALQIPLRVSKQKTLDLGISAQKYEETIKYKKADIQVRLSIIIDDVLHQENLSLKKANKSAGFNQVDKRSVRKYKEMWNFDNQIEYWLQAFTGEILPQEIFTGEKLKNIRDHRRLFLTEIPNNFTTKIINFFTQNKLFVVEVV